MLAIRARRSPASLAIAASTALLAAMLTTRMLGAPHSRSYLDALNVVAATLACLITVKLCRDNCFESRLGAVLLAVVSGIGALLATTIGLPGEPAHPAGAGSIMLMALAIAVPLLVVLDQQRRSALSPVRRMLRYHVATRTPKSDEADPRASRRGRRPDRRPADPDARA